MDISELFPKAGQIQRIYCDNCGGNLDLRFSVFHEEVTGVDINIIGLPELYCEQCNLSFLPEDSRLSVIYLHEQATKHGSNVANVTPVCQPQSIHPVYELT
jgi:YgiT-type zinc finger domain-containing protein